MPNFGFLGELGVTFPGRWGGWLESDNKPISVHLNLTGTEIGNNPKDLPKECPQQPHFCSLTTVFTIK